MTTDSTGKVTNISGQRNHIENSSATSGAYNYEELSLPSGETIYFGIQAIDAKGNYTTVPCFSNGITIPNYITPQAPSSLTIKNQAGNSYGKDDLVGFTVKENVELHWNIAPGEGSDYGIGAVQYRMNRPGAEWITVNSEDLLLTGPDDTVAVNGILLDVDSLWEGSNYIEVRGVDSNPTNALTGPSANIEVRRDTLSPVLEMVYPQGQGDPPVWTLDDEIEISFVYDHGSGYWEVEAELGIKTPLGTAYRTVFSGNALNTETPVTIPLNSLALGNYEYAFRITVSDILGNAHTEERRFI